MRNNIKCLSGKWASDPATRKITINMTTQRWNFAAIDAGSGEILQYSKATQDLLENGKRSLTNLASTWGGTGSEAYQSVQQRWDAAANELNSSLSRLANAIAASGQAMAQTESSVTGMFA